jgi:manganese/zinc/iron transport system substrate-binding protein
MGEGVDPHLYKPSPGDMRLLTDARLVLFHGLHLEGKMGDTLERLGKTNRVVDVGAALEQARLLAADEAHGHPDPHVWFDVALWATAIEPVKKTLATTDPSGAATFEVNAAGYAEVLKELDAYARSVIGSIPEGRRILVTAHDAFGYLGRAYGIEVLAIQGISTDSEASLKDINALVDLLVSRKVPAVFVESSVPPKTIEALVEGCRSRGHALIIRGELFSDAMGKEGTSEGTYVGMVIHNVDTIARALGGTVPSVKPSLINDWLKRTPKGGG